MNVARLNLSHDTTKEHVAIVRRIREVARELKTPIGILFDIPGPKIRVGRISPEPLRLKEGNQVILTGRRAEGNRRIIPISHPKVLRVLKKAT